MKEIDGAYIFSGDGGLIFSLENLDLKDGSAFDSDYLGDFLSAVESIALNIGEEEVNTLEFGNIKFFHTRDKLTKIGFAIKCKKNTKPKKIKQVLTNLMNVFLERFTGNFSSEETIKKQQMESFIETISEQLGKGNKVEYFLDKIKIER